MAETSIQTLASLAARLGRAAASRQSPARACPALWFFTDPARTPDPAWTLERLPPGAAVVWRAFGEPGAVVVGQRLRRIAARRRLIFLVGQDAGLAARLKADGVHLPERLTSRAAALRHARPLWRISVAAHSPRALALAQRLPVDAVVLSAAFASQSPSAPAPIGPLRFAALARRSRLAVVALGGIDARRARRLLGAGAAGLAAVSALAKRRDA